MSTKLVVGSEDVNANNGGQPDAGHTTRGCLVLLLVVAGLLAATATASLVVYDVFFLQGPRSVSDLEDEFQTALALGSSEVAINAYLDSRGMPWHETFVVTEPGSQFELRRQYVCGKVSAGVTVVLLVLEQDDGSLVKMDFREVSVLFELDQERELARIVVFVYDGNECSPFGQATGTRSR